MLRRNVRTSAKGLKPEVAPLKWEVRSTLEADIVRLYRHVRKAISGHPVAAIAISRDAQPGNSSGALTASNVLPPCVRVMAGDPSALCASRTFICGIWAERTPSEERIKRMGS